MTTRTGESDVSVSTKAYPNISPEDVAVSILVGLPQVARVRVWALGLTFLDPPSADVTREQVGLTSELSDEVVDVATAVMLTAVGAIPEEQADDDVPSWLVRRCTPLRPYNGRGRPPASGRVPPV